MYTYVHEGNVETTQNISRFHRGKKKKKSIERMKKWDWRNFIHV